jgi:hypothetical protein
MRHLYTEINGPTTKDIYRSENLISHKVITDVDIILGANSSLTCTLGVVSDKRVATVGCRLEEKNLNILRTPALFLVCHSEILYGMHWK